MKTIPAQLAAASEPIGEVMHDETEDLQALEESNAVRLSESEARTANPVAASHWIQFHTTVTRLIDAGGLNKRGYSQLQEDLEAGWWRPDRIPDGFRVQAQALRNRVDRMLEHYGVKP